MRSPKSGFFKSTTPREIFFSVDETFVTATPDAGPPLITETPHDRATMADNKDALRALKIKTGVLTRVKKELAMYHKEVETEGAKLEKMKSEGMDPHDIKQQDQVLGESSMMIGDCTTRMENAFNDLVAAMVRSRKSTRRGVRSRDPLVSVSKRLDRPAHLTDLRLTASPLRAFHLPATQDEHGPACEGSEESAAAQTVLDEVESMLEA